jgi:hypothetical protein
MKGTEKKQHEEMPDTGNTATGMNTSDNSGNE